MDTFISFIVGTTYKAYNFRLKNKII